jgi:hypothetical protein
MRMFPKIVFRDLGDLSSTIGTFKEVLGLAFPALFSYSN